MEPHERRDVDAVIDEVARAMTGAAHAPDLRPALASRLARQPSRAMGWGGGLTALATAAVVIVAVVMRPPHEPQRVLPGRAATEAPRVTAPVEATRRVDAGRPARAMPPTRPRPRRYQTIAAAAAPAGVVEIEPVAIVPFEDEGTGTQTYASVEIAPIDVEPVRISQLELVE